MFVFILSCEAEKSDYLGTYRQNLSHTALLPVSRAPRKSSKSKPTGKTSPTRHFCRYPACRENPRNRKLPAKPLPHASFAGIPRAVDVHPASKLPAKPLPNATFAGIPCAVAVHPVSKLPAKPLPHDTFAGIPRAAKILEIVNYRQNLSHTPLLPVSRAPRKSSKSKTTGKTSPTRLFCRYPTCRENLRNRKLPAKHLPHDTFAGTPRAAKILEIENYRQNLSHTPLLPVSRAPRKSSKSKTTGKTSPTRLFCRYPAHRENLRNRKLPAKPLPHGSFAGIPRAAKIFEIENYRQNLSHTPLLPVTLHYQTSLYANERIFALRVVQYTYT